MRFPAVIFDLDGTLADTLQDLAEATNWGLAQLGLPNHPTDDYRYMVGMGRTELCRRALPDDQQEHTDRLCSMMTEYYSEHCFDHTRLYPGTDELLSKLKTNGVKLAVLSNKPQNFVDLTVNRLIGTERFDLVLGESETTGRKPDPRGALMIATKLSVPAEEFAYVGDTSIDMETAVRAKMLPIGVTWGFRDRAELEEAGARIIVDGPDELYRVLTGDK